MKKLTPYRLVAKEALINWNGLTIEEALKEVETKSYTELENQVWATSSMTYAKDALAKELNLNEAQQQKLYNAIFGFDGNSSENIYLTKENLADLNEIEEIAKNIEDKNVVVLSILSAIHDGWVKDNASKFNKVGRESKRYQHMPLELIGWKEAKADLLFLSPILNSIGISLDMPEIEKTYISQVKQFLKYNKLTSLDAMVNYVLKGKEVYPALTEKVNTTKDIQIAKEIAEQIDYKIESAVKGQITEKTVLKKELVD